jgi:peptidoglycan/LPS O-acetylase OafA/YrhL
VKYRPEIDGLRAIAVIIVVLYHLGFTIFSGGFIGVDIFFVISGFLITTIISNEIDSGKFSIIHFYERRIKRILPALMVILLLSSCASWIFLPPNELINFTESLFSVLFFSSNIFFWHNSDYFTVEANLKPLLHTWSLAVEEQFYLFFPLLIFFIKKHKKNVLLIIFILCIFSLALSQFASIYYKVANFYLAPTRFWELFIGSLCSILISNRSKFFEADIKIGNIYFLNKFSLSIFGILLIIYATIFFDKTTPYPSFYTLVPTIGTALIILFSSDNKIGKLLANKYLVFVGLTSYSAYLIHQPLIVFFQSIISKYFLLFIIFFLAYFSYKFIETPCRKKSFSNKKIKKFAILSTTFFLIYSIYILKFMPFPFEDDLAQMLSKYNVIYATNMDERKFIISRIKYENKKYNTLVLGSSRVKQINKNSQDENLINLGVSGASIEDIIGIGVVAANKFNPNLIYIGVDPWFFNLNSGKVEWKSIESHYIKSLNIISNKDNVAESNNISSNENIQNSNVYKIYRKINQSYFYKVQNLNDSPGIYDKIRRDGSRVYNSNFTNLSQNEIDEYISKQLHYSINDFQFSNTSFQLLVKLIKYLQYKHIKVVLVLSPYHPALYSNVNFNKNVLIDTEKKLSKLASSFQLQLLGSYDPNKCGCTEMDFFDGLHPKSNCMYSILSSTN